MMHALLLNHFAYASSYPVGGASEIAMHIIPVIERSGGRVLVRANGKSACPESTLFSGRFRSRCFVAAQSKVMLHAGPNNFI